jgi:hypothetical protein
MTGGRGEAVWTVVGAAAASDNELASTVPIGSRLMLGFAGEGRRQQG